MGVATARAGIAIVAWAGLGLQFALMVGGGTPGEAPWLAVKFFSYFTILTNLLVALAETVPLLAPASRPGQFFDRPGTRTAIATYIVIVGVVYAIFLADMWNPQGWQLVADIVLHRAVPLLFVLDWLFLVPKSSLRWSDALRWLTYPLVYSGWTFAHGAMTGFYPYWFLDVGTLGAGRSVINALMVAGLVLIVGLAAIAAGRLRR